MQIKKYMPHIITSLNQKNNNYLLETEELRLLREDFGVGGRLVTEIGVSGMNICSSLLVIFFVVLISGSISLCTSTCDI